MIGRGEYRPPRPAPLGMKEELAGRLPRRFAHRRRDAASYCTLVFAQTGSYEGAPRRLGIDRRMVKEKVDLHSWSSSRGPGRDGQAASPVSIEYYNSCDILTRAMTPCDLRRARQAARLSQVRAAARLGVSQPYLAMLETGSRRMTPELARRAMRVYHLPATVLPPAESGSPLQNSGADGLARDLAALGYPGFTYLRPRHWKPRNPSEVLLAALTQDDLEARLVEALPWVVLRYWPLDRDWLVRHAKLHDLQNRLGFVLTMARRLVERAGDEPKARAVNDLVTALERSRLAREDTLCRASLAGAERRWLKEHRSADARHWNLLTDWTADAVRYVT